MHKAARRLGKVLLIWTAVSLVVLDSAWACRRRSCFSCCETVCSEIVCCDPCEAPLVEPATPSPSDAPAPAAVPPAPSLPPAPTPEPTPEPMETSPPAPAPPQVPTPSPPAAIKPPVAVEPPAPAAPPAAKPAAPAPEEDDPFAPAPAPRAPAAKPASAPPAAPEDDNPFAPLPAKPAAKPAADLPAKPAADPTADPFKITAESPRLVREWVDDTGLFRVRGQLIALLDGKVRILKETGRTTTVPLTRLSRADLDYVAKVVSATEIAVAQAGR